MARKYHAGSAPCGDRPRVRSAWSEHPRPGQLASVVVGQAPRPGRSRPRRPRARPRRRARHPAPPGRGTPGGSGAACRVIAGRASSPATAQRLLEVVEVRGVVDVAHRIQVLGPDARHVADGGVRGGRQRHAARLEGAGRHVEHGRELRRDAARHAPDDVGHDPVGVAPQDQPSVRQAALGAAARPDPAEPGDRGGERRRPARGRAAPGSPAPPPAPPRRGRAPRTRRGRSPCRSEWTQATSCA